MKRGTRLSNRGNRNPSRRRRITHDEARDARGTSVPNSKERGSEDIIKIDLTKPEDCREFLRSIKVDGQNVKQFVLKNGKTMIVDDMTDEQAIHYANHMYFEWFGGQEGGGFVRTDIDRGLH